MLSVVILTLNEERNLPRCLASVQGCGDVVVLDSGSTDRTTAIAVDAGARVFTRAFDDFARQRNYAQQRLPLRNDWVFHLDADEQFNEALLEECLRAAKRGNFDGYMVAPKMMFAGRWIPHCTDFPAYQARFVRASTFSFIQVGHGQREAPGMKMGRLKENYFHDLSSGGETDWLEKHRRYAKAEAHEHFRSRSRIAWKDFVTADSLRRRRALKRLSYDLPYRPLLRFIYQYGLKRGFLDGVAGYRYCRLLAKYESFAVHELRHLRTASRSQR